MKRLLVIVLSIFLYFIKFLYIFYAKKNYQIRFLLPFLYNGIKFRSITFKEVTLYHRYKKFR